MSDTKETEKKGPGAKGASLASMVAAGLWIGALSLLKAFWGLMTAKEFGLSMEEILLSGVVLAAIFTPVYLSIILDKIRDIKIGGGT